MDGESLLTACLALCCVLAVGTVSTSLDHAVSTDPDEVINIRYADIPLEKEEVDDLKHQMQDERPTTVSVSVDEAQRPEGEASDDPSAAGTSGAGDRRRAGGSGSLPGAGTTDSESTGPVDRVLSLLEWLFDTVVAVSPYLLLSLLVALAIAYRRRLATWLHRIVDRDDAGGDEGDADWLSRTTPTNEVAGAWRRMVLTLELDQQRSKTPREYADEAIDEGRDTDAITGLTDLFEEVRYGRAGITEERRRRARSLLDRLGSEGDER